MNSPPSQLGKLRVKEQKLKEKLKIVSKKETNLEKEINKIHKQREKINLKSK